MKKTKINVDKEMEILDNSLDKLEQGIKTAALNKSAKKRLAKRLEDIIDLAESLKDIDKK